MTNTYLIIIALAFLSGLTTLIGASLAIFFRKKTKIITAGIGFSAGIMLLISFLELIPGSINSVGAPKTLIALIFGVILIGSLNLFIPHHHINKETGEKHDHRLLKTAYLCSLGLILHDFPEGFAMANSYIISPSLGILIAITIALHNIPEEFAMAIPIVLANKKKSFLFKLAFISGLAEPAGAIIGLAAIQIMPTLAPLFMSFAAGAMIFIALHELWPLAKSYQKNSLFFYGIIASLLVYIVLTTFMPG